MAKLTPNAKRVLLIVAALFLVLIGIVGFGAWYYLFREEEPPFDSGEEHFKYASIGTENQDGIPYWIWLVLPRVFPEKLPRPGGYASLGLVWEQGKEMPVGFTKKIIGFERVGITCAACHSATYRTDPKEAPVIVPTGAANRFDIQAYLRSLLARALGELGRIPKTLHLLTFIDDPCYRRDILTQLNHGEGRHRLSRKCFHGQRGELRQRYREGKEDQLGALGLIVNALVLWNTRYMDAALSHLRSQGTEIKSEDVARLSPLADKHFNMLGRYHFTVTDSVLRGDLRPLRDPNAPEKLLWVAGP